MEAEATDLPKLPAPARRALLGAGYTRLEHLTEVRECEVMRCRAWDPRRCGCSGTPFGGAACPSATHEAGRLRVLRPGQAEVETPHRLEPNVVPMVAGLRSDGAQDGAVALPRPRAG